MIRSLLLVVFLTSNVAALGQVFTMMGIERNTYYEVEIPAGKVLEILGFHAPPKWLGNNMGQAFLEVGLEGKTDTGYLINPASVIEGVDRGPFDPERSGYKFASNKVVVNHIAGPAVLRLYTGETSKPVLTYKLTDNIASSTSKPASPKADEIKLTDEFLMLDYTVKANTTYKLGISKDLKNWQPLFEFTPESDKLNVELPKIILGNESYLKLE